MPAAVAISSTPIEASGRAASSASASRMRRRSVRSPLRAVRRRVDGAASPIWANNGAPTASCQLTVYKNRHSVDNARLFV